MDTSRREGSVLFYPDSLTQSRRVTGYLRNKEEVHWYRMESWSSRRGKTFISRSMKLLETVAEGRVRLATLKSTG